MLLSFLQWSNVLGLTYKARVHQRFFVKLYRIAEGSEIATCAMNTQALTKFYIFFHIIITKC